MIYMNNDMRTKFIQDFPPRMSRSGTGYWRVYTTTKEAGGYKRTAIALADPGSKTRIQSVCQFTFRGDTELASALAIFAEHKQCLDKTAFDSRFRLWLSGQETEADVDVADIEEEEEDPQSEDEEDRLVDDSDDEELPDPVVDATQRKRKIEAIAYDYSKNSFDKDIFIELLARQYESI